MSATSHVILGNGALATEIRETLRLIDPTLNVRLVGLQDEKSLDLTADNTSYYLGVGEPKIRSEIAARFFSVRESFPSLIHPGAFISESTQIAKGTYVSAQTVISTKSKIGYGAFINYGAKVGHDVCIDEFCVIAPNAIISGWCETGSEVMIGANATLLPGIKVGKGATVGAGAVVLRNVEQDSVVVGNPAVNLERK